MQEGLWKCSPLPSTGQGELGVPPLYFSLPFLSLELSCKLLEAWGGVNSIP